MAAVAASGFTIEDLGWARAQLGNAHVELDPWGNLIVSPASDLHEAAVSLIMRQLVNQLADRVDVVVNGVAWRVAGGSGYVDVPDITVLATGWHRRRDEQLIPAPLLVVEVASPSTRAVDRGRKLEDYRRGAAGAYLLVDLPTLAPVTVPTFELNRRSESPRVAHGRIELEVGEDAVVLDLVGLMIDENE